ncbi:type II toxin-antitoxin system RelE/ParE family toxin [Inquilinus sp. NPDC058860]|uniref:type II toxin-antitoxin system RelE/ParE family toxin n=1 Tax=Inquilinus sp. NPDC058860 TaxID=3346652 RepID=UPI0036CB37B4
MRVEWQDRAQQDTFEIVAYIDIHNPFAALAIVGEIRRQVATLAEHPHLGRPGRRRGTRELVVNGTPYIVAYRIDGNVVRVIHVRHGARRWPRRL